MTGSRTLFAITLHPRQAVAVSQNERKAIIDIKAEGKSEVVKACPL